MRVTHGDPQYLVLFDENGRALCTCTSEENRDALIEAINSAAEWEEDYDTAHRMREAAEAELRELKAKLAAAEATVNRIKDLCDYAEEFYLGTPDDVIKVTIRQVREDLECHDTRSVSSSIRRAEGSE